MSDELHDLNERMKDPFNKIRFLLAFPSAYDENNNAILDDEDMERLTTYTLELREQRDKLLAALQALVTAADDGVWHSSEDCQTEDRDDCRLCAAIAAAKGLISDGNREEE